MADSTLMRSTTSFVVVVMLIAVLAAGCGGRLGNRDVSTTRSPSTAPSPTVSTSVSAASPGITPAGSTADASLTIVEEVTKEIEF